MTVSAMTWRERAGDLFPGGVNSPVRAHRAVGGDPLLLERGSGAYVWDPDGARYLDYVGAFGPLLLGHAHPAVVEAIRQAAGEGGGFGATSPSEVRLGEMIRAALPGLESLRFVSSGTEAAMSALRVARGFTGRDLVIKFDGGYHGHSDALLVRGGSGLATLAMPDSGGVPAQVAATTLVAPYNDAVAVRRLLEGHPGAVAAIIVEPVAANMGVVVPADGFLEQLRAMASEFGVLLVFDEVITGFRVSAGGAAARLRIQPDLYVLGKIIGGGLPVGAFGGRRDVMAQVAPAGTVYQAGTLSGHPIAMAAGQATLSRLDASVYHRLEQLGAQLEEGLLAACNGLPISVARVGSLLTVFFRDQAPRNNAEAAECDTTAFARFFHGLLQRGVRIAPSQFEAWFISTAHQEADILSTIDAAHAALAS